MRYRRFGDRMSTILKLRLEPHGKGRPRVTFNGKWPRAYTPPKTAKWEKAAALLFANQWPRSALLGPVKIEIDAISRRPKRLNRKKDPPGLLIRAALPDADNVAKCVLDALQKAEVIKDDKQVVDLRIRRLYSEKEALGRIIIRITEVEEAGGVIQSIDSVESP